MLHRRKLILIFFIQLQLFHPSYNGEFNHSLILIKFYLNFFIISDSPKIKPFSFSSDIDTNTPFVVVSCILSKGSKPISFQWLKDGNLLINNNRLTIRHEDMFSVLEFRKVNSEDIGNYTCVAKNSFGSEKYTSLLYIKCT